jgi:acetyl-CoA carboxylase biotin carboxyl carrier protein
MPLNSLDIKELQAIVDWVNLTDDVRELSIKFGDVELFISRDRQSSGGLDGSAPAPVAASPTAPAPVAAPAAPTAATPAPAAAPTAPDALAADEVVIKSPMVGTYYASPKPGDPTFVSIGDTVIAETVLCIVEVMKLMNSIEAQIAGTVTKILVEDNQAVEYGQPLMVVKRAA